MTTIYRISDSLAWGDQPTVREMRELNRQGFRTLVDARLPSEHRAAEADDVRRTGLHYLAVPVAQLEWSERHFDVLHDALTRPRALPAFIHSGEGARAGILALTFHAHRVGWTLDELEAHAQDLGLDLPDAARAWFNRKQSLHIGAQP